MEHMVIIGEYIKGKSFRRPVTVDGVEYPSMTNMYGTLGIHESTVAKARKELHLSYEDAIIYALEKKEKNDKMCKEAARKWQEEMLRREARKKEIEFIYNDVRYPNYQTAVKQLSKQYQIDLNATSIKQTAKRNHISVQEAIEKTIERKIRQKEKREKECRETYKGWCDLTVGQIYEELKDYRFAGNFKSFHDDGFAEYVSTITEIDLSIVKREIEIIETMTQHLL